MRLRTNWLSWRMPKDSTDGSTYETNRFEMSEVWGLRVGNPERGCVAFPDHLKLTTEWL
jgi:hypothetical protein